ncbi:nitronate monooxygenase [Oceanospirillum multiglobuliferum]|uniref:Nitronate monooxygenase n=1 Tax=Oceanospirillum multiglobuliferum TaxID=64969 RepID=A0A1T4RUV9_9GAMM|nr:nitronate monooxygenase [Oceanospirillum multiglobuliferum]OPX54613.1 2-nitropropane dioxygenase [Oceanospirillum multiglobuliferum]SKA19755.1 nitronate monooxygenase [Oceanospirillum multiglobuliferum]
MALLPEWLAVRSPIFQAPMAGVQGSELAIAVSRAGGLGALPCAMLSAEQIEAELLQIQAAKQPINLNFFCHTPPEPNAEAEQQWLQLLTPYFSELGLDPRSPLAAANRQPFNQHTADLVSAFKPEVVSFHFGLPAPDLLAQVKAAGCFILSSATTVEEGLWLQANGADAVIAQGLEAGGHRGMFLTDQISTQMGSFALVAQLVQALDAPVIAAGGIADAKGVKAALALGASAVQIGTAYLLCTEAKTTALHRQALKSEQARHTALTNLFSGRPARGIVNRVMRELGCLNSKVPAFPLAGAAITALRQAAEANGSSDFSPLWAGQNCSGCQAISAFELTKQLADF